MRSRAASARCCTPVSLPTMWLALVHPDARVDTADIFAAPELTRDTPSAKIDVFSESYGRNDLARVTAARFPRVAEALAALKPASPQARMTGSGACVFAAFASERDGARCVVGVADAVPKARGQDARTPPACGVRAIIEATGTSFRWGVAKW